MKYRRIIILLALVMLVASIALSRVRSGPHCGSPTSLANYFVVPFADEYDYDDVSFVIDSGCIKYMMPTRWFYITYDIFFVMAWVFVEIELIDFYRRWAVKRQTMTRVFFYVLLSIVSLLVPFLLAMGGIGLALFRA